MEGARGGQASYLSTLRVSSATARSRCSRSPTTCEPRSLAKDDHTCDARRHIATLGMAASTIGGAIARPVASQGNQGTGSLGRSRRSPGATGADVAPIGAAGPPRLRVGSGHRWPSRGLGAYRAKGSSPRRTRSRGGSGTEDPPDQQEDSQSIALGDPAAGGHRDRSVVRAHVVAAFRSSILSVGVVGVRPAPGPDGRLHPGQPAVQRLRLGRRPAPRRPPLDLRYPAGRQRQLRLAPAHGLPPPPRGVAGVVLAICWVAAPRFQKYCGAIRTDAQLGVWASLDRSGLVPELSLL